MAGLEIAVQTQIDFRLLGVDNLGQVHSLDDFLLDLRHRLLTLGQAHFLLAHLQHEFLALLLDGQHAAVAVEGSQSGTVAVLHLAQVHHDIATACRPLHALCQRVGCQIEVRYHARSLQSQESGTLRQAPRLVHGVVVPLPVQAQLRGVECVGAYNTANIVFIGINRSVGTQGSRHLTILVAQLGPSVNPADRRDGEHAAHAVAVLEHDAVPVALLGIDDGALCQIAKSAEVRLQNSVLLPGAVQVLRAVAHLAAMTAGRIDMRYELCVVSAVVLDDTCALQQSALVGLTLEVVTQRALDDAFQVACQLAHLACTEEDIRCAVVVEEQRGIVEVTQARVNGPRTFGLRCGEYIGIAH